MSLIKKPTKLELEGIGTVTVRSSDYVTQGGEGAIYRKGSHVLKLSLDRKKMLASSMPDKIKLLNKKLNHPSIVVPAGLVYNRKGNPLGYHLPYINGESYPRIFTNAWRNQHGFTDTAATKLAHVMHEVVTHAHNAGALIVDGNELNWLANIDDIRDPVPYAIDVDSWQVGQFKAKAIMPSIRDWHQPISKESDWFAWGIVTFLLYTGIHPYKGKLAGYKPGEMERRMKDNASVFLPDVRLNQAVRDFSVVPGPLLDWYKATFEDVHRSVPPSPLKSGVANTTFNRVLRSVTTAHGGLVYEELLRIPGENILSVWPCGVVRTDSGKLIEVSSRRTISTVTGSRVAVVAKENGHLIAEKQKQGWRFRFITRGNVETELKFPSPVLNVLRSHNRLFAITENELIELALQMFQEPVLTTGSRRHILSNSTKWFSGVGVSDVLGAMHLIVPYSDEAVAMVRTPELDGKVIVAAQALDKIATVTIVDVHGQYQTASFAAQADWRSYTVHIDSTDSPELNIAILPKGVVASIREDQELVITVPTQGTKKVVNDKGVVADMLLGNIENQVTYKSNGTLWSLRMN